MRATQYADGVKRINAKIEVPLSATDVGDYILCAIKHQNINLNKVQQLNKRQLFQLAKDEILVLGTSSPTEAVFDVDSETKIIVRNYVKQMFPELS